MNYCPYHGKNKVCNKHECNKQYQEDQIEEHMKEIMVYIK